MAHETGVSPRWTVWIRHVAAEAERVERTRRKTCSRAESEFLCPSGPGCKGVTPAPDRLGDGTP
jgi:hypothetical protein